MMKIFKKEPNFEFMNKRFYAFIFSGILILLGMILFYTRGFNLGIDFTGGTNIEVSFREDISISTSQLRNALGDVGLEKSMIQRVGEGNRFFIKTVKSLETETTAETETASSEEDSDDEEVGISKVIEAALKSEEEKGQNAEKLDLNNSSEQDIASWLVSQGVNRITSEETASQLNKLSTGNDSGLINTFAEIEGLGLKPQPLKVLKENAFLGSFTFLSVETVGPQVGHDLRRKATLATVWAMLFLLIYIGFRFRFIFGIAAVITLLHDVLVSLSFILLFNVEVSLHVVAGVLAIVGYSLNDTIVIFDRVRDNLKAMKNQGGGLILDRSINQTLSRTIVTSGTTLCTVLALFFFGGEIIHTFSFTLLVGVIIGTYSSIFQSCAWLKIWEEKAFGGAKKK
jgi:preprotein translocase subunit SecF